MVWVDDGNAVFRRGLISCVDAAGFAMAGASSRLTPPPDLDRVDILLFDIDDSGLRGAVRLTQGLPTRLVGSARHPTEENVLDAVQAGVAGFLIRSQITPESLIGCLRAIMSGNGTMPPRLVASVLSRLAKGGLRGASAGQLAQRELDVLRLLSEGGDTRGIAAQLSYSERTVKNIVHDVLVRMGCKTRAHAVAVATRRGMI
jgi:DNA-binding NarL/FixJ family response regulator